MRVAVMLSGCGFLDGSEIHEAVLTLLALDRAGVQIQCLAPDIEQRQVVDHISGQPSAETRRVLIESARIARGNVLDVAQANARDYDALIFPGGFGAAKNLSDFAEKGADCTVQSAVLAFAQAMAKAGKPLGFICIAPALIPRIYGAGAALTIGNDSTTAAAITQMGGQHHNCPVRATVIDRERKIVSTPAYMLAHSIAEAADGIERLVKEVVAMAR